MGSRRVAITVVGLALAWSARAGAQTDDPPRLDEYTAFTVKDDQIKLGVLAFEYGLTDWFSIGTDTPAWAARAFVSIFAPNLHLKLTFVTQERWRLTGQVGGYVADVTGTNDARARSAWCRSTSCCRRSSPTMVDALRGQLQLQPCRWHRQREPVQHRRCRLHGIGAGRRHARVPSDTEAGDHLAGPLPGLDEPALHQRREPARSLHPGRAPRRDDAQVRAPVQRRGQRHLLLEARPRAPGGRLRHLLPSGANLYLPYTGFIPDASLALVF